MTPEEYRLLLHIDSPEDLKRLSAEELRAYCDELRRYIVDECSVNPGHLASSLGAVELAAALHYVFDTPADKIVWDVGHQTYAHKIITGRREAFKTKRRLGGISGFPRMSESEYDAFGGGHASVSISAAFGMAKAAELRGEKYRVVAVIGDGSMTGGLAFEGLNNAGASKRTNLLVILNDNNMAIDQATGALKNYLLKISTSVHYNRFKQRLWGILSHTPRLLRLCQKAGNAVKQGLLNKSNLFESLNFRYFGPVDGHNLKELVRTLRALRDIEGPKLLHVMTVKGKGYLPAEHNQPVWHAPGRFNPDTGERISSPGSASRYQDVFGDAVALFRRGHRRGACRDFLGGTRRRGHGALLQYLFDLHAAGLRQCDPRRRHSGPSGGDVSRPGRSGRRGRRDASRSLRHGGLRLRADTGDRRADGRAGTARHDVYGTAVRPSLHDPLSPRLRRRPDVARCAVRNPARGPGTQAPRRSGCGAGDRRDGRQRRRTRRRTRRRRRGERSPLRPALRQTSRRLL